MLCCYLKYSKKNLFEIKENIKFTLKTHTERVKTLFATKKHNACHCVASTQNKKGTNYYITHSRTHITVATATHQQCKQKIPFFGDTRTKSCIQIIQNVFFLKKQEKFCFYFGHEKHIGTKQKDQAF